MLFRLIGILSHHQDDKKRDKRAVHLGTCLVLGLYFMTYMLAQSDWLYPAMERFFVWGAIERSLSIYPLHLSSAEDLIVAGYPKLATRYYALTAVNTFLLLILCADLILTLRVGECPDGYWNGKKMIRPSFWYFICGVGAIAFLFVGGNDFDQTSKNWFARLLGLLGSSLWRPDPSGGLALGVDYLLWLFATIGAMALIWTAFVVFGSNVRRRQH